MIGAVICNGSNTMVIDLPTESLNLESKLLSIGIIEPAEKLLLVLYLALSPELEDNFDFDSYMTIAKRMLNPHVSGIDDYDM